MGQHLIITSRYVRFSRNLQILWRRLPIDGVGCLPGGSARSRILRQSAAEEFWQKSPWWLRPLAVLTARALWTVVCPFRARSWALAWTGWTRGKPARDARLHRAMARGSSARLTLAGEIPGDRQSGLLLRALGDPADAQLAADKKELAARLETSGIPVVKTILTADCSRKLLIKPRYGACARGLYTVKPGTPAAGTLLAEAAARSDLLIQPYVPVSDELRAVSPDAPAVVRVFTTRERPGAAAVVLSAMLKILPPGMDVPSGIDELLLIPIDVHSGHTEEGILLSRPSERWPSNPWNGVPVQGRTLADWTRICEICTEASTLLPKTPIVGWDVLLGPDGPLVLEANTGISLFRAALWHFEKGLESPVSRVLERWCLDRRAKKERNGESIVSGG